MAGIIKATEQPRERPLHPHSFNELAGPTAAGAFDGNRAAQSSTCATHEADELAPVEQIAAGTTEHELARCRSALQQAAHELRQARDAWLAHWQQSAVTLAVQIAQRVIRRQLDRQPQITLELVREALELSAGTGQVQLRMHPDDLTALGACARELVSELNGLGRVDIVADAAMGRGGCRVDTQFGTIDQQIETQLARIEQELS